MLSGKAKVKNDSQHVSTLTMDSHSSFYPEIENVFTTPTTVSEASEDAKEIELEEELLSYCAEKERFVTAVYSLKEKKLDILSPYLKLLNIIKKSSKPAGTSGQCEEIVSENSPTESKDSKTRCFSSDMTMPKYFNWDFTGTCYGTSNEPGIPEHEEDQELVLLEDVLNILIGYDGIYIKANALKDNNERRTFRISAHIKSSLHRLVEKILPVASDYSTTVRFINENTDFSAGKVNQALAASFSGEVIEYMNNVLALEYLKQTEKVTLHVVWCALQEAMNKMSIMAKVADYIKKENATASSTLSILHRCTSNSLADAEAETICLKHTKAACLPYFQMLENWIYKGKICDPFNEFMVAEKADKGKANPDWDQKFELRAKCVPSFLVHDEKLVFNAGRYMYAVRKSMANTEERPCAEMEHVQYGSIELVYLNMIRRGYDFANQTLLNMLENDDVMDWLRTAKSFFSLEYGDVFSNIMDKCCGQLEAPAREIFLPYLKELIQTSIRTASFGGVPSSRGYAVKLEKCSLICQINSLNIQTTKVSQNLTGLEALTFTTNPPWPVRVVFHSKTLAGYQMLFRHIFYLRYVYMKLTSTRLAGRPKSFHALKYSMTVFVLTCLSYMTSDAVQTQWDKFERECRCVDTATEFIQAHNNFLYRALMGCMLASFDVFKCLHDTLTVCHKFCSKQAPESGVEFERSLVMLIKAASKEGCWSSFIKALIPIFTDIPEVVALNNLCVY